MSLVDEIRCVPGHRRRSEHIDCERHQGHYWCDECSGYYGVPHDGPSGCHTTEAVDTGTVRKPSPGQCACRFCEHAKKHGLSAAFLRYCGR